MHSVGLYTLGCKVSQYETEAVAEAFCAAGFELRSFDAPCDVYVINTCTVTAESDRKSRQIIRRAKKRNPDGIVIVMGCYTQRSPEEVMAIDGVSAVIGTDNKLSAVGVAAEILAGERDRYLSVTDVNVAEFEPMCITRAERTRAYVKIEDGCECRCTYCAIADARGRVRSKPMAEVIAEVEGLSRSGVREIVLTGIETGSYGRDLGEGYGLAELIRELDRRGSAERIRLGSLAPELIGRDFIEKVRGLKILAPHFHLSVQSGSSRVLAGMRRRYNAEMAEEAILGLRTAIPGVTLTCDMIVGFPGETDEDFRETLDFSRRARFLAMHVFAYSKRSGTHAATLGGQVAEEVKAVRSAALTALAADMTAEILDEAVTTGTPLSVLVETVRGGIAEGHTPAFLPVAFSADGAVSGDVVTVLPTGVRDGTLYANKIK